MTEAGVEAALAVVTAVTMALLDVELSVEEIVVS